jgi:hypothetical protein
VIFASLELVALSWAFRRDHSATNNDKASVVDLNANLKPHRITHSTVFWTCGLYLLLYVGVESKYFE